MCEICRIELPCPGFERLRDDATRENFLFIDRLSREYDEGIHRFGHPGEALLGAFAETELVAVGALVRDPFADPARVGRLRHIYVRPAFRRSGIGSQIAAALIATARPHYLELVLRAQDEAAARLYERLGFMPCASPNQTHELQLKRRC